MCDGKSKKSDTGPFPHQLIARINPRAQRESKERRESEKTFRVGASKAAAFSKLQKLRKAVCSERWEQSTWHGHQVLSVFGKLIRSVGVRKEAPCPTGTSTGWHGASELAKPSRSRSCLQPPQEQTLRLEPRGLPASESFCHPVADRVCLCFTEKWNYTTCSHGRVKPSLYCVALGAIFFLFPMQINALIWLYCVSCYGKTNQSEDVMKQKAYLF